MLQVRKSFGNMAL